VRGGDAPVKEEGRAPGGEGRTERNCRSGEWPNGDGDGEKMSADTRWGGMGAWRTREESNTIEVKFRVRES
jgi:hypothetical protein